MKKYRGFLIILISIFCVTLYSSLIECYGLEGTIKMRRHGNIFYGSIIEEQVKMHVSSLNKDFEWSMSEIKQITFQRIFADKVISINGAQFKGRINNLDFITIILSSGKEMILNTKDIDTIIFNVEKRSWQYEKKVFQQNILALEKTIEELLQKEKEWRQEYADWKEMEKEWRQDIEYFQQKEKELQKKEELQKLKELQQEKAKVISKWSSNLSISISIIEICFIASYPVALPVVGIVNSIIGAIAIYYMQ